MYSVTNPATSETVSTFEDATDAEIDDALARAANAFPTWWDTPVESAARRSLASPTCSSNGRSTSRSSSRPRWASRYPRHAARWRHRLPSAAIVRFYAENADHLRPEQLGEIGGSTAFVERQPVGVILGIMPWNFPYYQGARFAGPVLATGNTLLLKHAHQCPTSALALAEIFAEALPVPDAYVNVFASNEQIAALIPRPEIQGVSLTVSERAGAEIGRVAGASLKKAVLELGGSDPFVVLDDHELESVAATAVASRLNNSGQACAAPKRFIVADTAYDRFVALFTAGMEAVKVGDPRDDDTVVGPLVSTQALEALHARIKGATVHLGGERIGDVGSFYAPTVLTDVTPDMRVYREELFGPALIVYRVADDAEAIRLANDSPFGLGPTVFAADEARAAAVAAQLEVGMVAVNGRRPNVPDLPFGGVKRSGFGRELGRCGMEEFVNHKVVAVLPTPA